MRSWAEQQGFPPEAVRELNDLKGEPVLAADVYQAVEELSADVNLRQLVVYFCGHGMVTEGELWLLSGAPGNPNEAVNVPLSVRNAERGSVPHVVLLSDACRTATNSIQTGSVTGSVIFPNPQVIGEIRNVDLLYAAGAGAAGHQVAEAVGDGTFHPVFTEVLAEGLAGVNVKVVRVTEADGTFDLVRPRPLLNTLKNQVGVRLAMLGHETVIQVPDGRITSDEQAWLSRLDPLPDDVRRGELPILPDPPKEVTDPRVTAADAAAVRLQHPDKAPWAVGGSLVHALEPLGPGVGFQHGDGVMVVSFEESCTALPVYPDLTARATMEDGQLVDVTYVRSFRETAPPGYAQHRARVGAAARFGLAWWQDASPDTLVARALAVIDTDPSYALHAAYALVEMGRRDLVPRLLEGPRPPLYDVALLAERLDGPVAGTFPLLSRGWTLLGPGGIADRPDLPPRLSSPYTLFGQDAQDDLLEHLRSYA
ncbi:MAG: hypothetical protein WCF36_01810 [Candidatus Nanopelagicales bacterium]